MMFPIGISRPEWITRFQSISYFENQSLNGGIQSIQSPLFQFQINFWNRNTRRITFQYLPGQIFRRRTGQCNGTAIFGYPTPTLDFVTFESTRVT